MMPAARWIIPPRQTELEEKLMHSLGVSRVIAQILVNRGLVESGAARRFLNPEAVPPALLHLGGIAAAVERILVARSGKERVLIYGDYDVDGITSTVLLQSALREIGIEADYYIPDRLAEGYGLNREAVLRAADKGYSLIVTVDCGISSVAEVELARRLGMEVIITDHHDPPVELPPAGAVINPKLDRTASELAGVGVAYQLAGWLLLAAGIPHPVERLAGCLDLVALGTVADVVPLVGENRCLVREGLRALAASPRVGLRELLRVTGLEGKELDPWHIGFILGPRLNAAGRMERAEAAVQLLSTSSVEEAALLVERLERANQQRQEWERRILEEAEAIIESELDLTSTAALVLARAGWHQGVIGIVASRLAEKYGRPAVLFSLEGEKGTGSGRGLPGFDLLQALHECRQWLDEYGGHAQAAGMTIEVRNLAAFAREFNAAASRAMAAPGKAPHLLIDAVVELPDLTPRLLAEIDQLRPFGYGNPEPLLLLSGARVAQLLVVGSRGEHLKLRLEGPGGELEAIAFNQAGDLGRETLVSGARVDLAFHLEQNDWQGRSRLQLKVRQIEPGWPQLPGLEEIEQALSRGDYCIIACPRLLEAEAFWEEHYPAMAARGLKSGLVLSHQPPAKQQKFWKELRHPGFDLVLTTADFLTYHVEKFSAASRRVGLLLVDRGSGLGTLNLTEIHRALGSPKLMDFDSRLPRRSAAWAADAWRKRQWSFPGRSQLAEVFRYLRHLGAGRDWVTMDWRGLTSWWKQRRPEEDPDLQQLLPASLYILEELGLLRLRGVAGSWQVSLSPTGGEKVDLNQSLRFREGRLLRQLYSGMD